MLYPPQHADIAAVAFDFGEMAITATAVAVVAATLHFGSEWSLGSSTRLRWRPLLLATMAGLYSAAATACEVGLFRLMY